MDGVLFVIAANETCPQPQTKEHLMVLDTVGIKNIIIVQTKIDLVSEEKALENYKQIKEFVKGTIAENAPVIPVSAQQKININSVIEAIQEKIPTPERDETKPSRMFVIRSFDINKPGTEPKDLKGGVIGGAIIQGKLKIGDEIEISPGVQVRNQWKVLKTKLVGLQKRGEDIEEAGPGGLLGALTELDPVLTKSDYLTGSVAGKDLPPAVNRLILETKLFGKLFETSEVIAPIKIEEQLMINIGTARTLCIVKNLKKEKVEVELRLPVCCNKGERAILSRRIGDRWRLIAFGEIL